MFVLPANAVTELAAARHAIRWTCHLSKRQLENDVSVRVGE